MTEAELTAMKRHAENVDSRMSENCLRLIEEVARLEKDRDRLRAALKKYGRHTDTCGLAHYEGSLPCRCGLTEALAGEQP